MNVLLVDDEPFASKMLAHQLANLGFSAVSIHERARDALAQIERDVGHFGLIFCDLQMPDLDGVEFVRHLGRIGFAGGVVLVSGENCRVLQTVERLAHSHKLDMLGVLQKPVSVELLKHMVERTASRADKTTHAAPRVYTAEELRLGILRGEMVNYYQPKVEIATGVVSGMETLVRWQHPRDGLVYPDAFIGLLEEFGLIGELTRVVLAGALRQSRSWLDAGLHLHVAVNVSMDDLVSLNFPDVVAHELDQAGVPASSLTLEVTESRLMKDQLTAFDILMRLRLKRIALSIDDFGTGYSSLVQLRDIPFDELKIDRSFVHGAHQDASLGAIFEASLGLARQLDMKTVAEGVEDQNDWDYLRAHGCDLAQGYFVAKAMPAEDVVGWVKGCSFRPS